MRARIAWLVAATTSAVVVSFVLPLCLLVRTLAEDRAMAAADQEARNVALLVSTLQDNSALAGVLETAAHRGIVTTSVLLPDGRVLGAPSPGMAGEPEVRRARGGDAFALKSGEGGEVFLPVVVAGGTVVVRSSVTSADLHRGVAAAWTAIIGLGAALLAVALLVADRLGRRISRPLLGVAGTAHRLREGDLGARATVAGTPETRELARALNGLADRILELAAAERAAVAELSHRLRTPVTALRLDAEAVADKGLAARLQRHLAVLQRGIDTIVAEARRPVRDDAAPRCDLAATVSDRIGFWAPLAEDQGRKLSVAVPAEPVPVALAPGDVRDLLDILVDNVFAHTAEGVGFAVQVALVGEPGEGQLARLAVVDDGAGMRTGAEGGARPGTSGLGLDIVRRTAEGAGGHLEVRSAPGRGTRVEVRLPRIAG